ncbi:MAG: xanthine dehydrogenase family protein molybdopterin-binding subunit [Hyphomicrobiales bacterium]|nr:xanthine dehydrogenase family protein molybdopterin-binding subunit [Hyphomicrobiales bacterium]
MSLHPPAIGRPLERIEDLRLLRGRGTFSDDVAADRQLHAAILRSPVARGNIRTLDTAPALAMPGVVAVITAEQIGRPVPRIPIRLFPVPEVAPFESPVIADGEVRFVGEPIAIVLAESPAVAEDGRDAIGLVIDERPAVSDRRAALARNAELVFEPHGSNVAITYTAHQGDAAAAFARADYRRRETFYVHRHTAVPMENRGLLATWQDGRMVVQGAAKAPFAARRILAQLMALPESDVDMIELDVGGGFGARGEFYPEDFLIPFAARYLGRPVKWTEDRRDHLMTSNHARDIECELEIACAKDGTILGLRGRALCDVGAYIRTAGLITPRNVAMFLAGPYRVPSYHVTAAVLLTNKTPSGTYRGPGRYESDFFRERLIDLAAEDLGLDRVAMRRRNLVPREAMPYLLPAIAPAPTPSELDSGDYGMTLDRCLADFDWHEKVKSQGQLIDGWYHGVALGCFVEGGAAGPKETARLRLEADGTITLHVGSASVGQGLETVCLQIASDALEVPMECLKVLHGSTTLLDEGFGAYHSRSVVMGGSAILAAAANLREAIRVAAGRYLNCSPDQVEILDRAVRGPSGRTMGWHELAPLAADGQFLNSKHTYSYGAHAAQVAVDPKTGSVRLLDYLAVEDAGRIINPLTLHGQAIGAIVQGLGGTLLEHMMYDNAGQLLTGSYVDYLLPTATDFPIVRGISLEVHRSPINPLGAKGAGEGGTIPVGGLIANAVAAALSSIGVQPRELPLSPPRVWRLIVDAQQRAS